MSDKQDNAEKCIYCGANKDDRMVIALGLLAYECGSYGLEQSELCRERKARQLAETELEKFLNPEKKWCAYCGVWGDHQSGYCVLLLRDREGTLLAENAKLCRELAESREIIMGLRYDISTRRRENCCVRANLSFVRREIILLTEKVQTLWDELHAVTDTLEAGLPNLDPDSGWTPNQLVYALKCKFRSLEEVSRIIVEYIQDPDPRKHYRACINQIVGDQEVASE